MTGALSGYLQEQSGHLLEYTTCLRAAARVHADEPDVATLTEKFAKECERQAERVNAMSPAAALDSSIQQFAPAGLLRDLKELCVLGTRLEIGWIALEQAAQGARDKELLELSSSARTEIDDQIKWFRTRLKASAPQALLVS